MIQSDVYDYINVLDRAADASALRNKAIANNYANMNTPGYKRQDVEFATSLERELKHSRYQTLDSKVHNVELKRLKGHIYTDAIGFSYRLDGNNVDPDTEGAELAANQILYNGLTQSINAEFQNLKTVSK